MPGGLNLLAVPTAALNRRDRVPDSGTASYARSCAFCPEPSGIQTIHTRAEPSLVPLEVTTGALEPKPNSSPAVATLAIVGRPCPSTPDW
jgi:hypothetical protein